MNDILVDMWPIVIIQNRFGDHVGGGQWFAVANANEWYKIQSRATWILLDEAGPLGDERDAVAFWKHPPCWIAAGATPDAAIKALESKVLESKTLD